MTTSGDPQGVGLSTFFIPFLQGFYLLSVSHVIHVMGLLWIAVRQVRQNYLCIARLRHLLADLYL